MKKMIFLCTAMAATAFAACNAGKAGEDKPRQSPKPGTVVASAQVPVNDDPNDKLNKTIFSVKVIADSNITSGQYDIDVDYGPNFAEGHLAMPKGGETLVPIIRNGADAHTFIIGFKLANDTTFYDYFEINSSRGATKMQYIKAYTF